jgi:hypothetical protein
VKLPFRTYRAELLVGDSISFAVPGSLEMVTVTLEVKSGKRARLSIDLDHQVVALKDRPLPEFQRENSSLLQT